jgi:hypothetical protein
LTLASPKDPVDPQVSATCRGLLFVQLYGVYEYAIRGSVQATLDFIRTDSLSCRDLRGSVLALVLDPTWQSAATAGLRRVWEVRSDLIRQSTDSSPLSDLNDTLFPLDGSHFRHSQLTTIWRVFGVTGDIVPDLRLLPRISELVETRNAIAHGRLTALEVGSSHSSDDMHARIRDTDRIAQHVVNELDAHCSAGGLSA